MQNAWATNPLRSIEATVRMVGLLHLQPVKESVNVARLNPGAVRMWQMFWVFTCLHKRARLLVMGVFWSKWSLARDRREKKSNKRCENQNMFLFSILYWHAGSWMFSSLLQCMLWHYGGGPVYEWQRKVVMVSLQPPRGNPQAFSPFTICMRVASWKTRER